MVESQEHKNLKEMAHILLQRGYKSTEISNEYRLKIKESKQRWGYVVDVVGIKDDKKTAIELGTWNPKKLVHLELFFDEVIHIPYGIEQCSEINLSELKNFKIVNTKLLNDISDLKGIIKKQERELKLV